MFGRGKVLCDTQPGSSGPAKGVSPWCCNQGSPSWKPASGSTSGPQCIPVSISDGTFLGASSQAHHSDALADAALTACSPRQALDHACSVHHPARPGEAAPFTSTWVSQPPGRPWEWKLEVQNGEGRSWSREGRRPSPGALGAERDTANGCSSLQMMYEMRSICRQPLVHRSLAGLPAPGSTVIQGVLRGWDLAPSSLWSLLQMRCCTQLVPNLCSRPFSPPWFSENRAGG